MAASTSASTDSFHASGYIKLAMVHIISLSFREIKSSIHLKKMVANYFKDGKIAMF